MGVAGLPGFSCHIVSLRPAGAVASLFVSPIVGLPIVPTVVDTLVTLAGRSAMTNLVTAQQSKQQKAV